MNASLLEIPTPLWRALCLELRCRGRGENESGAFLLAKPGSVRVERILYYDDLDETALDSGIITFHAPGFVRLWDYCGREGFRVVADVHTHPTEWTGQSWSDQIHPMIAIAGHIALILPNYAQHDVDTLHGVGIYEYLGDHKWRKHLPATKNSPIKLL